MESYHSSITRRKLPTRSFSTAAPPYPSKSTAVPVAVFDLRPWKQRRQQRGFETFHFKSILYVYVLLFFLVSVIIGLLIVRSTVLHRLMLWFLSTLSYFTSVTLYFPFQVEPTSGKNWIRLHLKRRCIDWVSTTNLWVRGNFFLFSCFSSVLVLVQCVFVVKYLSLFFCFVRRFFVLFVNPPDPTDETTQREHGTSFRS